MPRLRTLTATALLTGALLSTSTGTALAADNPNRHPDVAVQELGNCGPGSNFETWDVHTGRWSNVCTAPNHPLATPKVLKKKADHWWNPYSWFN